MLAAVSGRVGAGGTRGRNYPFVGRGCTKSTALGTLMVDRYRPRGIHQEGGDVSIEEKLRRAFQAMRRTDRRRAPEFQRFVLTAKSTESAPGLGGDVEPGCKNGDDRTRQLEGDAKCEPDFEET